MDYDKIIGKLELRTRKAGDRLSPFGRGISKPVRRLQAEAEIPVLIRESAPIAADENGVIWGYKIGADKRVSIDEKTQNILIFKVYKS